MSSFQSNNPLVDVNTNAAIDSANEQHLSAAHLADSIVIVEVSSRQTYIYAQIHLSSRVSLANAKDRRKKAFFTFFVRLIVVVDLARRVALFGVTIVFRNYSSITTMSVCSRMLEGGNKTHFSQKFWIRALLYGLIFEKNVYLPK